MWKRRNISADPRINEWGPEEFVWWPYVLMAICFIVGLIIGLAI